MCVIMWKKKQVQHQKWSLFFLETAGSKNPFWECAPLLERYKSASSEKKNTAIPTAGNGQIMPFNNNVSLRL